MSLAFLALSVHCTLYSTVQGKRPFFSPTRLTLFFPVVDQLMDGRRWVREASKKEGGEKTFLPKVCLQRKGWVRSLKPSVWLFLSLNLEGEERELF